MQKALLSYASLVKGPFVCIFLVISSLFAFSHAAEKAPQTVTLTKPGQVDMCLGCHQEKPDKAHGREFGCAFCHLGNALSANKLDAHRGMVKNPGELKFVERTCGQAGCHTRQIKWSKNSLMATNRGILSTLRYYWGEYPDRNEDISIESIAAFNTHTHAVDYFRKLCGSCHLWVEKGKLPDFMAQKGGGCTACHFTGTKEEFLAKGGKKEEWHPQIIKKIPMENCVRCHNRSGRIGLSYQGIYESEGYGVPFEAGKLNSDTLADGRFYRKFPEDIHHKAGMVCIDCHTQREVMGDGQRHAHLEEQLEVRCEHCHTQRPILELIFEASKDNSYYPKGKRTPLWPRLSLEKDENGLYLKTKMNEKRHELKPPAQDCTRPVHKNLSCQACHSTWVPQCYGCHVRYKKAEEQLDKVSARNTLGLWQEFRGFIRHEVPPLGVLEKRDNSKEIVVLVPG